MGIGKWNILAIIKNTPAGTSVWQWTDIDEVKPFICVAHYFRIRSYADSAFVKQGKEMSQKIKNQFAN